MYPEPRPINHQEIVAEIFKKCDAIYHGRLKEGLPSVDGTRKIMAAEILDLIAEKARFNEPLSPDYDMPR